MVKYLYIALSLILALAVCLQMASAAPPFTTVTTTGLQIRPPAFDALKTGQNYDFPIHVFNITTGQPIISGIACYFQLYNQTKSNILTLTQSTPNDVFDYEFNVSGGNLTKGSYFAELQCNSSAVGGADRYDFMVTNSGTIATTSEGIVYMVLLVALLCIFAVTLYGAIKIPWSHKRDGDLRIVEVSKIRYFKPVLFVFGYIELMWMMGILYSLAYNILQYDSISAFFYWAYIIMLDLVMPIAFVTLLFVGIVLAEDRKLRKKMLRGFRP